MLHLPYREVAATNLSRFDDLAAFRNVKLPRYHYPDDVACAIGVADPGMVLERLSDFIGSLHHHERISTDNLQRLIFIQIFHDYRIVPFYHRRPLGDVLAQKRIEIPASVSSLVDSIQTRDDMTPEIYKQVMFELVHEST